MPTLPGTIRPIDPRWDGPTTMASASSSAATSWRPRETEIQGTARSSARMPLSGRAAHSRVAWASSTSAST